MVASGFLKTLKISWNAPREKRKKSNALRKKFTFFGRMQHHLPAAGEWLLIGKAISNCMDRKERALVEEIYKDCLRLKKRGELTEFGEGQLRVCEMLLGK